MDPLIVEVAETTDSITNPHVNLRPRFVTINGYVNYANNGYTLPEGTPGFYPTLKLVSGMFGNGDVVGFHY